MNRKHSSQQLQYVSFRIGDRLYGVDIHVVKEVNPSIEIAAVPLSNACYRGLVNIRGQIVLVIDTSIALGMGPTTVSEESQLVIFKTTQEVANLRNTNHSYNAARFGDKPVALLVDSIGDVLSVEKSQAEQAPAHLSEKAAGFVEHVVKLKDGVLTVLDPETILGAC